MYAYHHPKKLLKSLKTSMTNMYKCLGIMSMKLTCIFVTILPTPPGGLYLKSLINIVSRMGGYIAITML